MYSYINVNPRLFWRVGLSVSKQCDKIPAQRSCLYECPEEMCRAACGSLNVVHGQFSKCIISI